MTTKTSPTIEDYLLTIYFMERDSVQVINARLAERIGVAAPTVTATLQRMVHDDLVSMSSRKEIALTEHGRSLAEDIVRRHALAERLLTDILGLPWDEVHEEAHLMEHAISPRVQERLMAVLGDPSTCPHGNPIPGRPTNLTGVPLNTVAEGREVVVERITEDAEMDPDLIHYLQRHRITPGRRLRVAEVVRVNELMNLEIDGETVPLAMTPAAMVRVNPVGADV